MKGYQVLEDALEGKDYLINNSFSAADIAVSQPTRWKAMNSALCVPTNSPALPHCLHL